jgi:hypothetical protein
MTSLNAVTDRDVYVRQTRRPVYTRYMELTKINLFYSCITVIIRSVALVV